MRLPALPLSVAAVLCLLVASNATAMHKEAPAASRISSDASHVHPSTRSWGDYFAFASAASLAGGESQGQQIFIFRLRDYVCHFGRPDLQSGGETETPCGATPKPYIVQATTGPGDPDNPSVNGDGTMVTFDAAGIFGSSTGDAANHRQIFVKNLRTGGIVQVTNAPDGDSVRPSLNEAGGAIVFESSASLLGGRSGVSQIFVYHLASGSLKQITNGAGASKFAMMNKLGDHVAFQSSAALVQTAPGIAAEGADTGIFQIYWYDRPSDSLHKLTQGNGSSQHPYIEEKAPGLVFFDSIATNLPGMVPGTGSQIYAADTRNGELPAVFQYTFGASNCSYPAVEPNGVRAAFVCTGDLLQNGSQGTNLFVLNFGDGASGLFQLTSAGTTTGPVGANFGLWFVTAASTSDLAGTGVCGRQLYVLDYYGPDHYYELEHARVAATRLGQLPTEPAPADPNGSCDDLNECTDDVCNGGATCSHGAIADNTVCGAATVQNCAPAGVCLAGHCTMQQGPSCDDNDACTQDTCTGGGTCEHVGLPLFDGLTCRLAQLDAAVANIRLRANQQKLLRFIRHLIAKAPGQSPRQAMRTLGLAARKIDKLVALLRADQILGPDLGAVIQRLTELRGQVVSVRTELKASIRLHGGSTKSKKS